ncbi:MAG TPA: hypothetical protein VMR62_11670 [Bryobacteraceae bacterium]|nr:hypothetical protein [Bryobacteraceae bacterium]
MIKVTSFLETFAITLLLAYLPTLAGQTKNPEALAAIQAFSLFLNQLLMGLVPTT